MNKKDSAEPEQVELNDDTQQLNKDKDLNMSGKYQFHHLITFCHVVIVCTRFGYARVDLR